MASKQIKTYCRITDYLEVVDPDLYRLIKGVCADMALNSLRGKAGITFLMPLDKAFRQKLEKLAYSEKPADADKAQDMINACIIKDIFHEPSQWMAKKDDIPNSLDPPQHVALESSTTTEIIFKCGARATIDKDFHVASRKSKLAVWKLTSGEIPLNGPLATLKHVHKAQQDENAERRKKRDNVTGGYDAPSIETQSERYKIALAVENEYALCQLKRAGSESRQCDSDIYASTVLSLVNYIVYHRKDLSLMYNSILPLIVYDKMDFYILVEPHRAEGDYLLDDSLIHEWWIHKQSLQFSSQSICGEIAKMYGDGCKLAALYNNRPKILKHISDIRQRQMSSSESRPRSIVDNIATVYEELETKNTIGGCGPVYPPGVATMYAKDRGLKMIHDELRFLAYGAFKRLEARSFDIGTFHELTNMIGECLYAATATERSKAQRLLNKNTIKYLISPGEKIQEIRVFLCSTMFLCIPLLKCEADNLKEKNSIDRPNPSNMVVFNIAKDLYTQQKRILHSGPGDNDIVNSLRSLNVDTLDPELREEIRAKFA